MDLCVCCFKSKIIPYYQNDIVCKVYFLTVYEVLSPQSQYKETIYNFCFLIQISKQSRARPFRPLFTFHNRANHKPRTIEIL